MEPFIKNLTIASGQVATVPTQISAGLGNHAKAMSFKFCNVGGQEEELILTLSRNGATSVRIKRVVLAANEEFRRSGLPLNLTDSLLAVTTHAASIDYLVYQAGPNTPDSEETYDDEGRIKSAPYILEQLDAIAN